MTNDRRYLPALVILQNYNNGVTFNGSDKIRPGSSPIGSYYLVTDKAGFGLITGGSVTNDLPAPTIPRIVPTYFPLLRSYRLSASPRGYVNRTRRPDDKLADKSDANSISRMFRRMVARRPTEWKSFGTSREVGSYAPPTSKPHL